MGNPLVSISCITFNHAPYIRQCLDGLMMQKTSFSFELLIHDDASTDGTADIIKEYERKYPDTIKVIYEKENQWSKGRKGSSLFNFPRSSGKYIALCEGDDYWIDPLKLQKQVDFLENTNGYSAIASNSLIINEITNDTYPFSNKDTRDIITLEELILERQFHTASVMFRALYVHQPDFEKLGNVYDTMLWCFLLTKNPIYYVNEISCVYRRGRQGVTESTNPYKWACNCEEWGQNLVSLFCPKYVCKDIIYTNIVVQLLYYSLSLKKNITLPQRVRLIMKAFKYINLNVFHNAMKSLVEIIYKYICSKK